jgi:hypothetical protein
MHKPFDVFPKALAEEFPESWFGPLGWKADLVEVIDADVATVSGAADKVFRVGRARPWLAVLEFMSSYKEHVAERLHWHATLIAHRHELLVRSAVVLLRPDADGPVLTGTFQQAFPGEGPHVTFRYGVLRLWEIPPETLLAGGLGLALYAPLGRVEPNRLGEVVRKVRRRAEAKRTADAPDLLAAMYIMMGLRYDEAIIQSVKREVSEMEESITYQEIITKGKVEGRLEEARQFLALMGASRLGPPSASVRRKLDAIDELDRLHQLGLLIDKVQSWKDLLAKK